MRVSGAAWFPAPHLVLVVLFVTLLWYAVASLPGVPYHMQTLFGPAPSWPQARLCTLLVLFGIGFRIVVIQAATDHITALLPPRRMVPVMAGPGLWLALLATSRYRVWIRPAARRFQSAVSLAP